MSVISMLVPLSYEKEDGIVGDTQDNSKFCYYCHSKIQMKNLYRTLGEHVF